MYPVKKRKQSMESFLIVIADDLTGGMDTGAGFAAHGIPTLMISDPLMLDDPAAIPEDIRALSVNTASRALGPQESYGRVAQWAQRLARFPIRRVYKKIDSTLRGRIGEEIDAVMDVLGIPLALIAPAFPEQGRCTVGGIHCMDGQPIGATEIRHDPVMPVSESRVPALLEAQSRRSAALIDLITVVSGMHALRDAISRQMATGAQLMVFDAVRREHLRTIAKVALDRGRDALAVGSAGLAREIAGEIGPHAPRRLSSIRKGLPGGPVLVICGSRSRRSIQQIARLCGVAGSHRVLLRPGLSTGEISFSTGELTRAAEAVGRSLHSGSAVLTVDIDEPDRARPHSLLPGRIVAALAAVGRMVMDSRNLPPGGLVLTGGDTACAVLQKLEIGVLELAGEIAPGLPLAFSRSPAFPGLPVITKAGAFGGPEALVRCVRYLEKKT